MNVLSETIDDAQLRSLKLVIFDFDGVFTDNVVYVSQAGTETIRCSRSDGLGIARLRDVGVANMIVSTEVNPVVSVRAEKLKMECRQGVVDKAAAVKEISRETGIALEQIAFLGNDINDIPAFGLVGLPIGVADSYPEIYPYISCRTERRGGEGAVRELCDLIYTAHNNFRSDD